MEGTETSLPYDMVREILLHLKDVVDLFRCAVSCKQMRRIILEASFLHGLRWPDSTPSFLSGLFIWEKFEVTEAPVFATSFVPTKHSLFGPHRRNLKSFSPTNGMKGRKRTAAAQRGAARRPPRPRPPPAPGYARCPCLSGLDRVAGRVQSVFWRMRRAPSP
ncbi:hypothetical protein ZWY2020_000576 [Hordeum vulgare]|nr:hypothetical protein ZWY2020_000576 [Hordeum vulgare]